MLDNLTYMEKEIMFLLIQGHNFNGISSYLIIDYSEYKTLKKSLFKKLHITRIVQLLPTLIQNGFANII